MVAESLVLSLLSGRLRQVVVAGRRPFIYLFDLQSSKVERIVGLLGREEKSLETFTVSPSIDLPLVAFLGNPLFAAEFL